MYLTTSRDIKGMIWWLGCFCYGYAAFSLEECTALGTDTKYAYNKAASALILFFGL